MKAIMFILLLTFPISYLVIAQTENSEDYSVKAIIISKTGANLCKSPNKSDTTQIKVPFWSIIYLYDRDYIQKTDTLNGLQGYWHKVKYGDNYGYVLSNYFYFSLNESQSDYRLLRENDRIYDLNYDPTLNWYGIYKNQYNCDSLIKVNIYFEQVYSDLEGHFVTVAKTNLSSIKKSIFLIGSKENLEEICINNYLYQITCKEEGQLLFPGLLEFGIQVTGCVSIVENEQKLISDYKILLNNNNITPYLKGHNSYLAYISYYGDINNDKINDYIIFEYTSYITGLYQLLLSNNISFLTKAAELIVGE